MVFISKGDVYKEVVQNIFETNISSENCIGNTLTLLCQHGLYTIKPEAEVLTAEQLLLKPINVVS